MLSCRKVLLTNGTMSSGVWSGKSLVSKRARQRTYDLIRTNTDTSQECILRPLTLSVSSICPSLHLSFLLSLCLFLQAGRSYLPKPPSPKTHEPSPKSPQLNNSASNHDQSHEATKPHISSPLEKSALSPTTFSHNPPPANCT